MVYDRDSIFHEIQIAFRMGVGTRTSFVIEDRIDVILKRERLWNGCDLADVFEEVWARFGLKVTAEEAGAFWGVGRNGQEWEEFAARQFTFSALADFVAGRLALGSARGPQR